MFGTMTQLHSAALQQIVFSPIKLICFPQKFDFLSPFLISFPLMPFFNAICRQLDIDLNFLIIKNFFICASLLPSLYYRSISFIGSKFSAEYISITRWLQIEDFFILSTFSTNLAVSPFSSSG